MSSNSRTADSVQVAPFLTHVVSHHGRLTLIPPENAGRVRKNSKVQTKKDKKQPRGAERSARSEDTEESRFNLGIPRSLRPASGRRKAAPARAPVPGRSRDHEGGYGDDISIPDYPPPSFQEATSSSVQLPMLMIPSSAPASSTTQSSTTSSPISDCSPTTLTTSSHQRMLSVIVEPSSSPQSSPNPSPASASPSPSPFAFGCVTSQHNTLKPNFRLAPIPQSPTSDSDSDTSLDFVSLPLEPSQRQWEEDRLHGLTLEERVKREEKRQRAAQAESSQQQQQQRESDGQSPTQAGLSKCKSQEFLVTDRARGKGRTTLHVPPHPSWRLALDEPSLRSVSSNPSLAQANSRPLSPLSPLRPSSPTSRPYCSLGPASSSISLSLGHLKFSGAFGRSTTSLGAFSSLSNGRDGSASRRLFLKGKGKEKERSFSDGELDEREEEALDSWEVIDEEPSGCEPCPSTPKIRPRLTVKPFLKPSEISYSTYEEKSVDEKGSVENDTRVDPFPMSAESSSPEIERPSSITPTPTNFYPPPTPFSFNISAPAPTSSPFQPPTEIYDQADIVRRPRYGSIRSSQSPPPTATILSRQGHHPPPSSSPPPPSPIMRTGPMRAASPYFQTSPSRPSPLSGASVSSAMSPVLRNPMSVLAPTPTHPPTNRRSPPPPPSKSSPSLSMLNISRPLEGHEVPLPPTPSESDPAISRLRSWPSKSTIQRERETEQDVGRLNGNTSRPQPFFTSFVPSTYAQPSVPGDYPARARTVAYTHAPPIPSRLAVSIPAYSPSLAPVPIPSSPATPRSSHYRGRPLPMTPATPSAMLPAVATQDQNHCCCVTYDRGRSDGTVPEGLLIDFDSHIDTSTSSSDVTTGGDDMDRTTAAIENGDFSMSPVSAAARPTGSYRSPEDGPSAAAAASPAVTTPERSQFSEYTDLDLLASRLAVENHDGSDYDALLLVQDFVGPAAQNQNSNGNLGSEALSGKIVIERRRITKDGHVKLKISLLGTVVDKCGVCLSQFKEGQLAALGTECRHAFHKKCLRTWLARSSTCPQCRIPLRMSDSQCMP